MTEKLNLFQKHIFKNLKSCVVSANSLAIERVSSG